MSASDRKGSAGFLVLVLVVLVGAVGWNYQRNFEAEGREFRPYRSYAEADLEALIEAYEEVTERTGDRYESSVARRAEARGGDQFMGNVKEFERVQAAGRRARDARVDFADAKASLEILRKERAIRGGERSKLRLFLRRAFSF